MAKKYISLILLDIIIWNFYSPIFAKFGLFLIIISYLIDLGIFTFTKYEKGFFNTSEIFYFEFCGDYNNLYKDFIRIANIIEKYSLSRKEWNTFGFYYDNPKTTPKGKCRAVIGIQYENENKLNEKKRSLDENIKNWLKAEGFEYKKIDRMNSVISKYPLQNNLSVFIAIMKYYSNLENKLKDKEFFREFNIEEKYFEGEFKKENLKQNENQGLLRDLNDLKGNEINQEKKKLVNQKCIIEIYRENIIEFYLPLEYNEKLFLYKGLDDTLKMS
jgi:hypothetical protein